MLTLIEFVFVACVCGLLGFFLGILKLVAIFTFIWFCHAYCVQTRGTYAKPLGGRAKDVHWRLSFSKEGWE